MPAVGKIVAIGTVAVLPIDKPSTTYQCQPVGQFETGRTVNGEVFHMGKAVAKVGYVRFCEISVKKAQIRDNPVFIFFVI
ncbi:Uncharacterised protein [Mycobacteroides abscessus subsp. massiliense]|nr:Uncharacterised protein [Mycobacteroides abscessus subsp. massiliense]